jgi:hypothetical protein
MKSIPEKLCRLTKDPWLQTLAHLLVHGNIKGKE